MTMTKRELFLLAIAVRYMRANLDEVQDAFRDENHPEILRVEGGKLSDLDVSYWELDDLVDKITAMAISAAGN